jgi:hypothetical protein
LDNDGDVIKNSREKTEVAVNFQTIRVDCDKCGIDEGKKSHRPSIFAARKRISDCSKSPNANFGACDFSALD